MTLYQVSENSFLPAEETTFSEIGMRERADLQRILKNQISVISPDILVIAEEFGEWEDSKRRIDLLGLDKNANLVVIELKRTEDGGHMELQAIRYAAMVSTMTFEQATDIYTRYLKSQNKELDAKDKLLEFLAWEEADEDQFAQDVNIILASAEFSRELTTAVLWLNDRGLNIKCIRLKPYKNAGLLYVDVSQVIPLPEADEYSIRIREKQKKEREARKSNMDFTRYDLTVGGQLYEHQPKRGLIFYIVKTLLDKGIPPKEVAQVIPWRKNLFLIFSGELDSEGFIEEVMKTDAGGRVPKYKRYFYRDDELFHYKGDTYAITNQWGKGALEAVKQFNEAFPDMGITLTETQ